jgi:hypothetical protein
MRQHRTKAGTGAGEKLVQAQRSAEKLLFLAAQYGIVSETTIRPGNHTRFLDMSSERQRALLDSDNPTVESFLAAIEYAGHEEIVSEMTTSRIERALKLARKTKMVNGRPVLEDTPQNRAEAIRAMGIIV